MEDIGGWEKSPPEYCFKGSGYVEARVSLLPLQPLHFSSHYLSPERERSTFTKCPDHRDECGKSHVADSAGSSLQAYLSPCRGWCGMRFAVSQGLGRVQYERSVCLLLIRLWAVSQK
jgi:hypothetical protein